MSQGSPSIRFTVVIPTMNRQAMVAEALRSVVAQSYPAHEIIVVHDGGADGTVDAIKQDYAGVLVIDQANRGLPAARNAAIARATGEWIAFLDDDDLWHRDKLSRVAEFIEQHPDVRAINHPNWYFSDDEDGPQARLGLGRDFVATGYDACQEWADGQPLHDEAAAARHRVTGDSYRLLLERNRGVISGSVVHRETLIEAGCFPVTWGWGEDWAMFLNVARFTEWHTLSYRLGFTRFHSTQMTTASLVPWMHSLSGFLDVWQTGRPMPYRVTEEQRVSLLAEYGPVYRRVVQGFIHGAVKHRQLGMAMRLYRLGSCLLPRWRDRLYVWLPTRVTWRWDRRCGCLPKGRADDATGRWPALYRPRHAGVSE